MTRVPGLVVVVTLVSYFCVPSDSWSDQRAHEPSYDIGEKTAVQYWELHGSAKLSENGVLLTQSEWIDGSIWSKTPVDFSNWVLELDFEILRLSPRITHGDGIGLFYVRDRKHGYAFGTVPAFVGLGIVFDTWRNGAKNGIELPFFQAHVLNGSEAYMFDEDGVPTALVNVHAPVLDKSNSKMIVRYQDNALAVVAKYRNGGTGWARSEFTIQGVYLPQGYYFGVGARCGGAASRHKILGLKVYSLDGPDHTFLTLPRVDREDLFQDNEYVRWITPTPDLVSSSAVVLGYTIDAEAVFFARVVIRGQIVPAIYIPSLNRDKLYASVTNKVMLVDAKDAQILCYRYSRRSHLTWRRYPTEGPVIEEFRGRLLEVGYSNEGDILNICRSEPPEAEKASERSPPSGLGVFSISTGVCRYVNQIGPTDFEVRTTSRFSMSVTLPTNAS